VNAGTLQDGLTTAWLGRALSFVDVVDSTNRWAADELAARVQSDGAVFVASRQTRGRGTGGSLWCSDDPDGLWFSVVVHEPVRTAPLSFLPGVALVDLVREELGVDDVHLKWPNDVLSADRKLAGILLESQRQVDGRQAWIMGIGVNVNQAHLPNAAGAAVSLRLLTGRRLRIEAVFQRLLARVEQLYDERADLIALWRERSRMIGKRVRATRRGDAAWVHVLGIDANGHLQVVRDDGMRETWVSSADLDIDRSWARL
jgi:BirA family biotin operon repressor/biotin-[acetyl-CoA-carboxylase] ligase